MILCVNSSMSEMVTYLPITSPFIRFAGRFVDESFGVAAGWNFFIFVIHPPAAHNLTRSSFLMRFAGSSDGAVRDCGLHSDPGVLGCLRGTSRQRNHRHLHHFICVGSIDLFRRRTLVTCG